MPDLAAGHGAVCSFEDEDRFDQTRRCILQAIMHDCLQCFSSTSAATVLDYGFGMHAPYGFWSLSKLFGNSGGVLLTAGYGAMVYLKQQSDRDLGDPAAWGGDFGCILLLGIIGLSGLVLHVLGSTALMSAQLAIHLGGVLHSSF